MQKLRNEFRKKELELQRECDSIRKEYEAEYGKDVVTEDQIVSVPFIQLYDDDIYTYTDLVGTKAVEGWLGLNK